MHENAQERGQNSKRETEEERKDVCACVLGKVGIMLDEPNQILDRLGLNEQVRRNWAKTNGSQIRRGSPVNNASSTEQKDFILNFTLSLFQFLK